MSNRLLYSISSLFVINDIGNISGKHTFCLKDTKLEEVTGRDNQIICQALQIAIPIMLKYSMSSSNTSDMISILESRGNLMGLRFLDGSVREYLEKLISDIQSGNTLSYEKNSSYMDAEIERYLSKI